MLLKSAGIFVADPHNLLTHLPLVPHIYVGELGLYCLVDGSEPVRRQAITSIPMLRYCQLDP